MIFEEQKVLAKDYMWSTNGSQGVIRVLSRVFCWFRGITTEVTAAFRAYDGRESFRLNRRESINNNIFDPVSMVTRTAAVFVPFAGIRIEFQKLFPDWVGHIVAPQLFAQTTRTL
jgi:hypothetical protein